MNWQLVFAIWRNRFVWGVTVGMWLVSWSGVSAQTRDDGATPEARSDAETSSVDVETAASLIELLIDADADSARASIRVLADKLRSGELNKSTSDALRRRLEPTLAPILKPDSDQPLFFDVCLLAVNWKDAVALQKVRLAVSDAGRTLDERSRAIDALVAVSDDKLFKLLEPILAPTDLEGVVEGKEARAVEFRALQTAALGSLGRSTDRRVADAVLGAYPRLDEQLKPKAIELLTQRAAWSKRLLDEIGAGRIPADALNANQVVRLQLSGDESLRELVVRVWGTVRTERNPQRDELIAQMRELIVGTPGDERRGETAFHKLCGQCHKIHGRGEEVGPDITANGRNSFDQLLSNVFDPSLVIGSAYQARLIITVDGRVLTGLLAEENDARVVLKLQGGKLETVARDDIDELSVSPLSMMPEGLEKQLTPQEIADLFAFLTLDLPPGNPNARRIPGTPVLAPKAEP